MSREQAQLSCLHEIQGILNGDALKVSAMKNLQLALGVIGVASGTIASANVFFTFDDPSTAKEVTYVEGNATGPGLLSYSSSVEVDLVVDASLFGPGFGVETYQAALTMELEVGQAIAGRAALSGEVRFSVEGEDILIGEVGPGGGYLLGLSGVGSLWMTNTSGSAFAWTHHGVLSTQLAGIDFNADMNGSFSLSEMFPEFGAVNANGYFRSFIANAAFVGGAEYIIPVPLSAGPFGLCLLLGMRRTRRRP